MKDTYDEKILLDLILLDGEVCKRFCASVLNKDIKIKQIYKHQIFSIILLLKYFEDVR